MWPVLLHVLVLCVAAAAFTVAAVAVTIAAVVGALSGLCAGGFRIAGVGAVLGLAGLVGVLLAGVLVAGLLTLTCLCVLNLSTLSICRYAATSVKVRNDEGSCCSTRATVWLICGVQQQKC